MTAVVRRVMPARPERSLFDQHHGAWLAIAAQLESVLRGCSGAHAGQRQ